MAFLPQASHLAPQRVGVLADDLTGAGDTALQYFLGTGNPDVWIVPELHERPWAPPPTTAALAVNVESRHLLPGQAAARVDRAARFLARSGCNRFYQKVDSTLRGNMAAELLQALHTLDLELAIVAPAFPQAGRITVGGYQLVDGVPVNVSSYGRDPVTPVKHCHLPTLLAEPLGWEAIAHLELREVMTGPEAVVSAIVKAVAQRKRALVIDAARAEDLAAIARGMALTPYRLLPVGSAGLAKAMQPHHLLDSPRQAPTLLALRPPVLLVAGSLNPVTLAQVRDAAQGAHILELDVRGVLLGEEGALERTVERARQLLLGRQDVLLTTASTDEAKLARDRQLAKDLAMGGVQLGATLTTALGRVVARLVGAADVSGLVLAGGDTALGVCRALGGGAMRVTGELMPAIPVCRLELPGGPLRVVTKSGGFGAPDTLRELARRLKRGDAS
ncbi:MAG: hypothetical protein JWM80_6250 [Cyanobacteria bacterium RYN_339]|nr:hypothetical protein [Cyanobacteria bacterium RYN_339]